MLIALNLEKETILLNLSFVSFFELIQIFQNQSRINQKRIKKYRLYKLSSK